MANTTDTATEITLKGSVDIVSEFFFTAINSILYQRGKSTKTRNETNSREWVVVGEWTNVGNEVSLLI